MTGELIKARLAPCDKDGRADFTRAFFVQFNPNSITIDENVGRYGATAQTPGVTPPSCGEGSPQTTPPSPREGVKLSTELFFNTYNGARLFSDVRRQTAQFSMFYNRTDKPEQHILFSWGSIQVHGVLTSLHITYTMFAPSGVPVRARASLSIEGRYFGETVTTLEKRCGTVYVGKLPLFALTGYADPCAWKSSARENGVLNPRAELL